MCHAQMLNMEGLVRPLRLGEGATDTFGPTVDARGEEGGAHTNNLKLTWKRPSNILDEHLSPPGC
jgi:hypothetical protein